jgi:hypothetical protein
MLPQGFDRPLKKRDFLAAAVGLRSFHPILYVKRPPTIRSAAC